jgi:hypothetical protein
MILQKSILICDTCCLYQYIPTIHFSLVDGCDILVVFVFEVHEYTIRKLSHVFETKLSIFGDFYEFRCINRFNRLQNRRYRFEARSTGLRTGMGTDTLPVGPGNINRANQFSARSTGPQTGSTGCGTGSTGWGTGFNLVLSSTATAMCYAFKQRSYWYIL